MINKRQVNLKKTRTVTRLPNRQDVIDTIYRSQNMRKNIKNMSRSEIESRYNEFLDYLKQRNNTVTLHNRVKFFYSLGIYAGWTGARRQCLRVWAMSIDKAGVVKLGTMHNYKCKLDFRKGEYGGLEYDNHMS